MSLVTYPANECILHVRQLHTTAQLRNLEIVTLCKNKYLYDVLTKALQFNSVQGALLWFTTKVFIVANHRIQREPYIGPCQVFRMKGSTVCYTGRTNFMELARKLTAFRKLIFIQLFNKFPCLLWKLTFHFRIHERPLCFLS
jgi:hypothetical protein